MCFIITKASFLLYFSAVHLTEPRSAVLAITQFTHFSSNINMIVLLSCKNSSSRKGNKCIYFARFSHFPGFFLFFIL